MSKCHDYVVLFILVYYMYAILSRLTMETNDVVTNRLITMDNEDKDGELILH